MKHWNHFVTWLYTRLCERVVLARSPDFIVGQDAPGGAYLRRWWLIPRNKVLNVYLHHFLRDDDDRALHDHPWIWCSLLLRGSYIEHTILAGGVHRRQVRTAGSIKLSLPRRAHRIELISDWQNGQRRTQGAPCWTLFITGPRVREWGFLCPNGWVPWQKFTAAGKPGEIGAGCE